MDFVEESKREGEKDVQAMVADAFDSHRVGDLMQASVKLSEALHAEMQRLCYERQHKDLRHVAKTEVMPDWMEGADYIAGRESGLFAVLDTRLDLATKLIKLAPAYVPGYLQRASVLCVLNRWTEARETYLDGLTKCDDTDKLQEALWSLDDVQEAVFRAEATARDELRGQRLSKRASIPVFTSLPPHRLSSVSSVSSTPADSSTSKHPPSSRRSPSPKPCSRRPSLPGSSKTFLANLPSLTHTALNGPRQQCPHLSALARRLT